MKLEGYEIVREISRGPITTVYLAIQKALDRPVFLKVLNVHVNDQPDLIERFRREAKICARLKHPNIVQIFDFGDTDGSFFISMEYIEGKSLVEIVRELHPLPPEIIFFITREIARGLAYAHQFGVIHRDIKPANIMVETDGSVKITDFGLATRADLPTVTAQFSAVGTPAYMSPEQALGEELTVKTDLFSLGATVYELCTGHSPFDGQNVAESIGKVLNHTPPPLHKVRKDIPEWFSDLVGKLLAKQPDQRPESAQAVAEHPALKKSAVPQETFAEFLKNPQEYHSPSAPTFGATEPRSRRWRPKIIGPAIVALLLVLFFGLRLWHTPAASSKTGKQLVPKASDSLVADSHSTSEQTTPPDTQTVNTPTTLAVKTAPSVRSAAPKIKKRKSTANLPGHLFVVCTPWAKVYVDGAYRETTPLGAPLTLSPGEHRLELRNPNFSTVKRIVRIRPGRIDTLRLKLTPVGTGLLKVQVVPWAKVFLDGKLLGETPLEVSVPAGKHVLMVRNPQRKTHVDTIYVDPGRTVERRISLQK